METLTVDQRIDALIQELTLDEKVQLGGDRLTGMLEVNVAIADELDVALEEAIAVIGKAAAQHRIGVMVTRTGAGRYIVRAHPAVPYGLVRQQHE